MTQTAKNWLGEDRPRCLHRPMDWAFLAQRPVRSSVIAIGRVGLKNSAQMRGSCDHDMVEVFTPDRADQSFSLGVLPGRPRGDLVVADAHCMVDVSSMETNMCSFPCQCAPRFEDVPNIDPTLRASPRIDINERNINSVGSVMRKA